MTALTHTLDLDPSVEWRIVGIPKTRRTATAVVGGIDSAPEGDSAPHANLASRARLTWIQSSPGDIAQLGFFVLTLATIGWLHVELLALVW